MYICENCGRLIDDISTHREQTGFYGDEPYYEEIVDSCICGGDFVEAEYCARCGEYYPADEGENGLCRNCQNAVLEKFTSLLEDFTPAEKEFIWHNWTVY